MLLINNSRNPLSHEDYKLPKGKTADIPEHIAKIWLEIPGVKKYIEPAEAEKAQKEAKAREAELLKENEALKAKLAELEAKDEKPALDPKALDLEALKKEADVLGIKYPQNIGAEKLAEKIAEAKTKPND